MKSSNTSDATKVVHLGRDIKASAGFVNLPVYHGSTVLYDSLDHLKRTSSDRTPGTVTYGRRGTPASFALENAVAELEGAHGAITTASGLAAITGALLAFLKCDDHILVADSVYQPTRKFCDSVLKRFGVSSTYYDPLIGAGIEKLIQPNTKVIFTESPGSHTFEIQDLPAIARVARQRGVVTIVDNTWGTPIYLKPFDLGIDVSVHAATKYITGHADAMLGIICANERCLAKVRESVFAMGECAGPDTIFLALRGLRTLTTRLRQHQDSGLRVARWLGGQPEIQRVIHPALPEDPGHYLWKRDFRGSCGLFGFILSAPSEAAASEFLDALTLFGMGYSWGGYESLLIPTAPEQSRTATNWQCDGYPMRIHVGLEDADDLIADLENGLNALRAFSG